MCHKHELKFSNKTLWKTSQNSLKSKISFKYHAYPILLTITRYIQLIKPNLYVHIYYTVLGKRFIIQSYNIRSIVYVHTLILNLILSEGCFPSFQILKCYLTDIITELYLYVYVHNLALFLLITPISISIKFSITLYCLYL